MITSAIVKNAKIDNVLYPQLTVEHYRTNAEKCSVQTLHIDVIDLTFVLILLVEDNNIFDISYNLRVKVIRSYNEEIVYSGNVTVDELSTSMTVQNILRGYLTDISEDFKSILDQIDFYNFKFNFK